MNKSYEFLIAISGLVVLGGTGLAADSAPPPGTAQAPSGATAVDHVMEQVTVSAAKPMNADQAKAASSAALNVMKEIADARGDIHGRRLAAAQADLARAEALVDRIREVEPTYRVKDRLWIANRHLDYEDTVQVMPDLVPVASDLDLIEGFVPTQQAREHLAKAKEHLRQGDKAAARKELALIDEALVYTEIDMPLGKTSKAIATARRYLAKRFTHAADLALRSAEESMIVTMDGFVSEPASRATRGTASQK